MENLIAQLFAARDLAHMLHLRTRSFAQHLALNDLYEGLLEGADTVAELYQGKYGILNIPATTALVFQTQDAQTFIRELAIWAESSRSVFNPADTNLLNEWDNVLSIIYRAKYKLENLT
jgi:hypothetical protein